MKKNLWIFFGVLAVAGLVLLGAELNNARGTAGLPKTARNVLIIETAQGVRHKFNIELAETPEQKTYGLMFRKEMPEDAGMLFPFGQEQVVHMWMKNTFIPLDMIFTDSAGKITRIHKNAVPHSLETIEGGMAAAVLEINGGIADKLGIMPGDVMKHPVFGN